MAHPGERAGPMNTDVATHIGAVVRRVADRTHEGKPARVVIATRDYDTDIADCWDALTNGERIARWFLPISGELKLGGKYQFKGNAGGTITRCGPPRHLSATWEMGGGVSWVNVTLTRLTAATTRLELEHIAHPDPHWQQYGPGAVGIGWESGLMGLAEYLRGGGLRPEDGPAWMATDEGKGFIRLSGEGWRDAAIAGGDDPDTARRQADATIAAYSGG